MCLASPYLYHIFCKTKFVAMACHSTYLLDSVGVEDSQTVKLHHKYPAHQRTLASTVPDGVTKVWLILLTRMLNILSMQNLCPFFLEISTFCNLSQKFTFLPIFLYYKSKLLVLRDTFGAG